MLVLGSIQLIVCRLPPGVFPVEVARCLRALHERGVTRFIDLAYVSRDLRGILHPSRDLIDLGSGFVFTGNVLLQLLEGNHVETSKPCAYELCSAREVGYDIDAVEGLLYRIEPGTSALLALVEPVWVMPLVDAVRRAGGASLTLGFLEQETMLIVGPQLAAASATRRDADEARRANGAALLDALQHEMHSARPSVADTLTALVNGGVLSEGDIPTAIAAVANAGLASSGGTVL